MPNVFVLTERAVTAVSENGQLVKEIGLAEKLLAEAEKLGIKVTSNQPSQFANVPRLTFGEDLHAIESGTPLKLDHPHYGDLTRKTHWKNADLYENPYGITNSGFWDQFRGKISLNDDLAMRKRWMDITEGAVPVSMFTHGTPSGSDGMRFYSVARFDKPLILPLNTASTQGELLRSTDSINTGYRIAGRKTPLELQVNQITLHHDHSIELGNTKQPIIGDPWAVTPNSNSLAATTDATAIKRVILKPNQDVVGFGIAEQEVKPKPFYPPLPPFVSGLMY